MLPCRLINNSFRRTSSDLSKPFKKHLHSNSVQKAESTFVYPSIQVQHRLFYQTTKSTCFNFKRYLWPSTSSSNPNDRLITSSTINEEDVKRFSTKPNDQPKASSTIDEEDVNRFSALADQWWKENGEFEALHTLNELRVPLICDALKQTHIGSLSEPLDGLNILDVGSGGGILAEPLARLGATVIGIDASEENIKVAQTHALQDPNVVKNLKYIHGSVEDLIGTDEGKFDAVVASEIVEHVLNAPEFIQSCCKLVKPGGSVFLTTLNKTYISYMLAVGLAENILRLVPRGTHDWEKFITPQNLQEYLKQNMMVTKLVHGMCYNPLTRRWTWINDTTVNYAIHAVKQTTD